MAGARLLESPVLAYGGWPRPDMRGMHGWLGPEPAGRVNVTEGQISAAVAAKLIMVTERHLRRLVADGWIRKTKTRASHVNSQCPTAS